MSDDQSTLPPILDDQPAEKDALGFDPYRDALADIINDPHTSTPLVIGLFGDWGSGKSTLMQLVRKKVGLVNSDDSSVRRERVPSNITVWFTAWKYDKEDVLWRSFLLRVLAEVRDFVPERDQQARSDIDDLAASLYRDVDREEYGKLQINWAELLKGSLQTAMHVGLALIPVLT